MAQYNPKSLKAEEFINHDEILETLAYADEHKTDEVLISQIIEKAKEDAADIVEKAGKIAENERQQIIRGAQDELMGLTMAAVSKVIGNNVDEESNRKLLDDFLAEEVSK